MFMLIVCAYEIRKIFEFVNGNLWFSIVSKILIVLLFLCMNMCVWVLYGCVSVCVFVNFCCIIVDRFRCWIVSTFSIYFHSKIKRNHWRITQCRLFSFEARLAKLDPLINVLCFTFSIVDFLFGSFLVKFNR